LKLSASKDQAYTYTREEIKVYVFRSQDQAESGRSKVGTETVEEKDPEAIGSGSRGDRIRIGGAAERDLIEEVRSVI